MFLSSSLLQPLSESETERETNTSQKYCVGNIIGPHTFQSKDAPQYIPAEITIIVCEGVCVIIQVFVWWWYKRENAKKEKIRANPLYVPLANQQ